MARSLLLALFLHMAAFAVSQEPAKDSVKSEDFSFALKYGLDGDIVDTGRGTVSREVVVAYPTTRTVTVELKLTKEELTQIEKALDEINFWDLERFPEQFRPPGAEGLMFTTTNSPTYVLSVTRKGATKKITWNDGSMSTSPPAINLRTVIRMIIAMVSAKPEYRNLPDSGIQVRF